MFWWALSLDSLEHSGRTWKESFPWIHEHLCDALGCGLPGSKLSGAQLLPEDVVTSDTLSLVSGSFPALWFLSTQKLSVLHAGISLLPWCPFNLLLAQSKQQRLWWEENVCCIREHPCGMSCDVISYFSVRSWKSHHFLMLYFYPL